MPNLTLHVNGETRIVDVRDFQEPLLYVLRNALALTGAKYGCGLGRCGACTVIVDGYIAVNADGSVTIYSGKVDLGQGLRIAIPQMAAEELGIGVERVLVVEGDTALTPDQGATGGSSRPRGCVSCIRTLRATC